MLDLAAFMLAPLTWPAQIAAILAAAGSGLAIGRWVWPLRASRPPRLEQVLGRARRPPLIERDPEARNPGQPIYPPATAAFGAPVTTTAAQPVEAQPGASADLSLMGELLGAIETGSVDVHLQPKYDVRRGRVGGLEALARWRHPTHGLLAPDRFVPIAERTGRIRALTEHVLARAIEDQRRLKRAGHELEVSVNISGGLLADAGFAEAALALADRASGQLCLELTETAVGQADEAACETLERFAEAGLAIAIDDFGAGRCSLASLRRVAAHELKIDRSLVLDLADHRRNTLLVRAAIDFGHSLGMKVTAEGVETNEAFALLAAMGCDFAQGFLIEQPMPVEEILSFLAEHRITARYG